MIIDAQVHVWYSDRPSRPWDPSYRVTYRDKQSFLQHTGQTNSPEMVRAEMAEAGVDAALLTSLGIYGWDIEHELQAAEADPGAFQVVGVVDQLAEDIKTQIAAAARRGLRGVRLLEMRDPARIARREFDPVLEARSDLGLIVVLPMTYPLNRELSELFRRFGDVFFLFNHLATGYAPPILGFRPQDPFEHLDTILELSQVKNLGLKLTGAPALSREPYPFRDIWDPVVEIVRTYRADRIAWGSDYTRTAGLHSYWEGVHYLGEIPGLAEEERQLLYAGTVIQRTGWKPGAIITSTEATRQSEGSAQCHQQPA
jgi:L-fuconolactonase